MATSHNFNAKSERWIHEHDIWTHSLDSDLQISDAQVLGDRKTMRELRIRLQLSVCLQCPICWEERLMSKRPQRATARGNPKKHLTVNMSKIQTSASNYLLSKVCCNHPANLTLHQTLITVLDMFFPGDPANPLEFG